MTPLDEPARRRRDLADRLEADGALRSPQWRAAVEAVPRERFLHPGVFLPTEDGRWQPLTPGAAGPDRWLETAYRDQSLVTQLDGRLTADQVDEPVRGLPTSSSTMPSLVVRMLETLDVEDGHSVLEIGTGTGYSTALACHRLGEDNLASVEVDPDVAARADAALEATGCSTSTVTGDGLLGHPGRAPYDRVIATLAVRRIPTAWLRQTAPGGLVLATVGSWTYGAGLAKVVVAGDGSARGRVVGRSTFMPARSQAVAPVAGDLSAWTALTDTERRAVLAPQLLREWFPAFLAQPAVPGAQLVQAVAEDGAQSVYLVDAERESVAALRPDGAGWLVRQGGPVALWDAVEEAILVWQRAGRPDIDTVQLRVTARAHTYWLEAAPGVRWEHRVA